MCPGTAPRGEAQYRHVRAFGDPGARSSAPRAVSFGRATSAEFGVGLVPDDRGREAASITRAPTARSACVGVKRKTPSRQVRPEVAQRGWFVCRQRATASAMRSASAMIGAYCTIGITPCPLSMASNNVTSVVRSTSVSVHAVGPTPRAPDAAAKSMKSATRRAIVPAVPARRFPRSTRRSPRTGRHEQHHRKQQAHDRAAVAAGVVDDVRDTLSGAVGGVVDRAESAPSGLAVSRLGVTCF
jgi:hypothetical protein